MNWCFVTGAGLGGPSKAKKERRQRACKSIDKIVIDDTDEWRKSERIRPMKAAVARAKIKPTISFHGLRHTWASHAVMNGVPFFVVAKNLGHSDTRMVERHYGHLANSYVKQAIKAGAPQFGFKIDSKVTSLPCAALVVTRAKPLDRAGIDDRTIRVAGRAVDEWLKAAGYDAIIKCVPRKPEANMAA